MCVCQCWKINLFLWISSLILILKFSYKWLLLLLFSQFPLHFNFICLLVYEKLVIYGQYFRNILLTTIVIERQKRDIDKFYVRNKLYRISIRSYWKVNKWSFEYNTAKLLIINLKLLNLKKKLLFKYFGKSFWLKETLVVNNFYSFNNF